MSVYIHKEIYNLDVILDKNYKQKYPQLESVKRGYIIKDTDLIKKIYTDFNTNDNYEIEVNVGTKLIIIKQNEKKVNKHSHYTITDYTGFNLILIYSNHDMVVEHLYKHKNSKTGLYMYLFILLLLIGGLYYLVKVQNVTFDKVKSAVTKK